MPTHAWQQPTGPSRSQGGQVHQSCPEGSGSRVGSSYQGPLVVAARLCAQLPSEPAFCGGISAPSMEEKGCREWERV